MSKPKKQVEEIKVNVPQVTEVQSLFGDKFVRIIRVEDVNKIIVPKVRPDGGDFWFPLGKALGFAEVVELFNAIKKFYSKNLMNSMDIVKAILMKFAFSIEFVEHHKGDKYVVDDEEREVKEDGWHENWDTFVVGPMNEEVSEMVDKAIDGDEDAIKFFFVPKERKVFSFKK